MRGKEEEALGLQWSDRITPAHAGKSVTYIKKADNGWDHPRACGEKTKKIP